MQTFRVFGFDQIQLKRYKLVFKFILACVEIFLDIIYFQNWS